MKESYEPLELNILMLSAEEPICASHDNGNVDIEDLLGRSRRPDDE